MSMMKLLRTLWMVYQYTQLLQRFRGLATQLPESKETTQGFHHEVNGDFEKVTEFNGCDAGCIKNIVVTPQC